jgi:hypothetical protein
MTIAIGYDRVIKARLQPVRIFSNCHLRNIIIILSNRLEAIPVAREISRRSYRKMLQNVTLAFLFNGIGIRVAATGLVYPVWAMTTMAVSVTAIFFNSLWGRSRLLCHPERRTACRRGVIRVKHDGAYTAALAQVPRVEARE